MHPLVQERGALAMAKSLSEDLRRRVIGAVEGGLSRHAAAARFEVAVATAVRWLRAWHDHGITAAKPFGGDRHSHRIEAFATVIMAAIKAQPDITPTELAELPEARHGARFARSTLWRFQDRRGVSFKKTAHAAEQDKPDVALRRQAWFDAQPDLDPRHLVFIDETGASTRMARLRGRSPRGERCRAPVPPPARIRALKDHHLHQRVAAGGHDRAHGAGWPDERRRIPGLC